MNENLIIGIVYSKFDEKMGPVPYVWIPKELPTEIKNLISLKSINLTGGTTGTISETLAVVPYATVELKSLVKFIELRHKDYRGGANDRTLNILFKAEHDLIFYRYVRQFEPIFTETANKLIEIEEANGGLDKIKAELTEFNEKLTNLLSYLHQLEITDLDKVEFPSEIDGQPERKAYKFKILLCGDPEVGKTSIALRFTKRAFTRTYIPTIGVNISDKIANHNGFVTEFIIWDIAGQAKFQRFRKHYYQGADGVFLVFDLTKKESFQNIPRWHQDIKHHLGEVPGYLIGNKSDLEDERQISEDEILKLVHDLNLQDIRTSALTGDNIDQAFFNLGKLLAQLKNGTI